MCRRNRVALLDKFTKQEEQLKKELAKTYLTYLETLPYSKRLKEIESILYETEIKRIISLDRRLTRQEWKCLYWAYKGKSIKRTAEILSIKFSTVREYRNSAIKKLKASNIVAAVALGIKYRFFPSADQLLPSLDLE